MTETSLGGARALVVGGAGFVGSRVVRALLEQGADSIVIVDNFLSAEPDNVPDDRRVSVVRGSIADDAVLARIGDDLDVLFHLATYHGNQSSIANPLEDHANNLLTTLKLYVHLSGFSRLRKLVYAASGCVLAPHTEATPEPVREEGNAPFDLDSPYQISKVVGELYSVYFHKQHGLPTVRARFQNVYGPGEILGAGAWRGTPATVWRNVVPTFVYKSLHGEGLPLDGGGEASRDFIYVDDIARGLLRCATHGTRGDVYNLATGVETTIRDLAACIDRHTGNRAPPVVTPKRSWDNAGRRVGSTEKAERELGFVAAVGLDQGIERTVAWTRAHLPLIERCIDHHRPALDAYAARTRAS